MADSKTQPTSESVTAFLNRIVDPQRRADCGRLRKLMEEITGEPAVLWGTSIVGFGSYHYRYASGREGDWPITGFAPRKQNLTIYITDGFADYKDILDQLGPHSTSVSCLYIKRLDDINLNSLQGLIKRSTYKLRQA